MCSRCCSLSFCLELLPIVLLLLDNRLQGTFRRPFDASSVGEYPATLNDANTSEAEVNAGQAATQSVPYPRQWDLTRSYSIFFGLMTKHHLVQIVPVATKAAFVFNDNLSAGLKKSVAPARTTPHFMTGAL